MVEYRSDLHGVDESSLEGPFFVGWTRRLSPATHLEILRAADERVVAVDGTRVVGFITALTDRILTAYIPLLEVVPDRRGEGIGTELVRRLLARLDRLYAVDVLCDPAVVPFYARLGFAYATGATLRRYEFQAGPAAGSAGDG